jgi:dihydropteroate synthase
LGSRTFTADELVLMAIVNITPDSFYDVGKTFTTGAAIAAAGRALDAGADIIDIGGVKAGQQGAPVSAEEELRRVVPVVAGLRELRPEAVISVDTWRADVARAVVAAGADLINDAWEQAEPGIVEVAARTGAGLVCTHAGHLPPRNDPKRPQYDDVVADGSRCVRLPGRAGGSVRTTTRRAGLAPAPARRIPRHWGMS